MNVATWQAQIADADTDEGPAIDGKSMCNASDAQDRQTHILGVVGHQTQICDTQKKIGSLPVHGSEELERTNPRASAACVVSPSA